MYYWFLVNKVFVAQLVQSIGLMCAICEEQEHFLRQPKVSSSSLAEDTIKILYNFVLFFKWISNGESYLCWHNFI